LDPNTIDKRALLELLRDKLEGDLHGSMASQSAAQAGATHDETRQEDPKDTRAIEATYLARGLAERVERMRESVAVFARLEVADFGPEDPIAVTALVALEDESGAESIYFLVPYAAGETLEFAGTTIRTLTPGSPLGRALIGKHVDDEVELELPARSLVATIAWTR
jgi:transcription elongation GreA/GreB family factor